MSDGTEANVQALQAELKVLRADFARIAELLKDTARYSSAEAAERIRESAERGWSEAKNTAQSLMKEMEERPVGSALTIFGIGVLLGMLLARR
jgi:ElaB/YqjD/DUF883 family membrane-anchored ribosome-binding protein